MIEASSPYMGIKANPTITDTSSSIYGMALYVELMLPAHHSKFWKAVKLLQQNGAAGPPTKLRVGDSVTCDRKLMANAFNDFFKRAGHILHEQNVSSSQQRGEEDALFISCPKYSFSFQPSPIIVCFSLFKGLK